MGNLALEIESSLDSPGHATPQAYWSRECALPRLQLRATLGAMGSVCTAPRIAPEPKASAPLATR